MTDFKVGDRVRATLGDNVLVGDVASRPVAGELELEIGGKWPRFVDTEEGWQVEKVSPPLPTKVGAIVRRADGELFVNDSQGRFHWLSLDGNGEAHTHEVASSGGFEVIFEGVES